MKTRSARLLTLFTFFLAVPLLSNAQVVTDKRPVVVKARQAYYNLRSEGLVSFQCTVTPNWKAVLANEAKTNPDGVNRAIETLNQLHFTLTLDAAGKAHITHNELPGQNKQMIEALQQIYGGMEQMASGFFDTWSLFALSAPFPEADSEYTLEKQATGYRLSYKDGSADVVTTMNRELAVDNMRVTSSEFDSTIQPQFTKLPKGFLINSYDALYKSDNPGERTNLTVLIQYQEVQGLQLLQKLNLSGTAGGNPFNMELGFSDCTATKK